MECNSEQVVAYTVDEQNRITWVCRHWWPFARDNGAPELHPDHILGKQLLGYISDPTTRQLYTLLMDRVRNFERPVELNSRCDGPGKRRFMTIRLSALPAGVVGFESRTVREEPRAIVPLLDRLAQRSQDQVRMCSWCKRVQVGQEWRSSLPSQRCISWSRTRPRRSRTRSARTA